MLRRSQPSRRRRSTVFDRHASRKFRRACSCVLQAAARKNFGPDLVVGLGGGSCLDLAKARGTDLQPWRPLSATIYGEFKVPGPVVPVIAVPTTAGNRIGSDPGGRAGGSGPRPEGRHLQSPPHSRRRHLRSGTDADLPAGADGDRGRRCADARDRGLHGAQARGHAGACRIDACLRRQERAERRLRPPGDRGVCRRAWRGRWSDGQRPRSP